MTRRQFLAALFAAIWAGPRAVAALIESHRIDWNRMPLGFVDVLQSTSLHGLRQPYMFGIDPRVYRKMQLKALEGFQVEPAEWDLFD